MARNLRIQYDGAVYHVTSRGNGRRPVFRDDNDRETFLSVLQTANERYNWRCHAYCLMTNHYHVEIETVDGDLSAGMRHLNGVYTQRFNIKHETAGHLFQGRFKAILIEKDSHFMEVCRYVVLNPVRAKLVKHPSEWRWSSFNGTGGRSLPHPCLTTDWVLSRFARDRTQARREYRQFVEDGIGEDTIWRGVRAQSILGSNEFVAGLIDYVKGHKTIREIPVRQRLINRPGLEEIFSERALKTKAGRNMAIRTAVEKHGYRQTELADYLGMHYSTVSRLLSEETARLKT